MNLSTAMRLGSMMKEQGFGTFYNQPAQRTCAIGAAIDAVGALDQIGHGPIVAAVLFPILNQTVLDPIRQRPRTLVSTIVLLNDGERWTREQIADYVESVEKGLQDEAKRSYEIRVDDEETRVRVLHNA